MACAGDSSVDPVDVRNVALTVEPTRLFITEGQGGQLRARLVDASGKTIPTRDVTWRSADPSIAEVDDSGVVTGVESGSVLVTAFARGKQQNTDVNVKGKGRLERFPIAGAALAGTGGTARRAACQASIASRTRSISSRL